MRSDNVQPSEKSVSGIRTWTLTICDANVNNQKSPCQRQPSRTSTSSIGHVKVKHQKGSHQPSGNPVSTMTNDKIFQCQPSGYSTSITIHFKIFNVKTTRKFSVNDQKRQRHPPEKFSANHHKKKKNQPSETFNVNQKRQHFTPMVGWYTLFAFFDQGTNSHRTFTRAPYPSPNATVGAMLTMHGWKHTW